MSAPLSITEYAVLGVLGEGPSHGFAISKHLTAEGDLGRILTVRRPLVYRALDRLVESGYARAAHSEKGDAGPQRRIHRITAPGRRRLNSWLGEPVHHVRDMRIEFLLKLTLLGRSGASPLKLIQAQKAALAPTLGAFDAPADHDDHIARWRRHIAGAVTAYLDELETNYR